MKNIELMKDKFDKTFRFAFEINGSDIGFFVLSIISLNIDDDNKDNNELTAEIYGREGILNDIMSLKQKTTAKLRFFSAQNDETDIITFTGFKKSKLNIKDLDYGSTETLIIGVKFTFDDAR